MAGLAARAGRCWARLGLIVVLGFAGASHAAAPVTGKLVVPATAAVAPLELRDMAGKLHRLSDYRGKVVLVNFWASWCEPCRDEMPSMNVLKQRMDGIRKDAFVVLAVNYAENEIRIGTFLQQQPLDFPVLLDPFSEVWRAWKPGLLPASFLIGRDGGLRYRVLGELDWAGPEAERAVRGLMQEKP
ncbi:MAG: redoxin domain-containing protein [Betaproteobacteria bacterium]|nr:redoxin domain-containing protein [Betaproteobacteria bacterium]